MKSRITALAVLVIVLFLAWYAILPERLFVNRTVHEDSQGPTNLKQQVLVSETFDSVLHATQGNASIYGVSGGTAFFALQTS